MWDGSYNQWEPFFYCLKNGLNSSQFFITTHYQIVASMMRLTNIIFIKELTGEEYWSLFKQVAFFGQFFKDSDQMIKKLHAGPASYCKGIGKFLQYK